MMLNWNKADGLVPAIIQDAKTNQILMLGYMNEDSLAATQKTGKVTFFSRTRQSIWVKGETSGNYFAVEEIKPDCDQDALLIRVTPNGPACHRNTTTCFDAEGVSFLAELEGIIANRMESPSAGSYTSKLIAEGLDRVAQKVGEEAIETVIAAKNENIGPLESEAADLLFHLMVLLQSKKTSLRNVTQLLQKRQAQAK
jgi:phosphoribosyl-ATP pyrophosphohydrolase/phosphoribosyl-AMP cyclohydrolase